MKTACITCGLIVEIETDIEHRAVCPRCHTLILKNDNMLYSLSLSIAALILMIPAMRLPFLTIFLGGQYMSVNIFQSVNILLSEELSLAAFILLFTIFIFPTAFVLLSSWVALASLTKLRLIFSPTAMKFLSFLKNWQMIDVFLVGILVSVVKLVDMVDLKFDIGFYLIAIECFLIIKLNGYFESKHFWLSRGDHDR